MKVTDKNFQTVTDKNFQKIYLTSEVCDVNIFRLYYFGAKSERGMGKKNNKKQRNKFIFRSIPDAGAYFVISAIIPIAYLFIDFFDFSNNIANTFPAFSLSFFTFSINYFYDYISRYIDSNEPKEKYIHHTLLTGLFAYGFCSLSAFVLMIIGVNGVGNISDYRLVYILLLVMGLYAPVVSLVELIRRIMKKHHEIILRDLSV